MAYPNYQSYNQYLNCCKPVGLNGATGPTGPRGLVGPIGPTGPSVFDLSGNFDVNCGLIIDVSGIYFCDGTYVGQGENTFDISSNQDLVISGKNNIRVDTTGIVYIGDYSVANNGTNITVDDTNKLIFMSDSNSTTFFEVNCNTGKIALETNNGFQLLGTSIQYPSDYLQSSTNLDTQSLYGQTFNGTLKTVTLPLVDSNNVGFQYLITNTNISTLSVASSGGQLIWSSVAPASNTSRSLNTGNSHIFTAIRTTGAATFGWSMV
jgi:hypothetical protein